MTVPKVDARSWIIGQLHAAVYSVQKGIRPVAEVTVPDSMVNECTDYIGEAKLRYIVTNRGTEQPSNHVAIYMYRDETLKDIICFTLGCPFSQEILVTWVEGKMFGYSNEEIGAYISNKLVTVDVTVTDRRESKE